MYKKVLVALDNSSSSKLIFEQGLTLAKEQNADLMLLHALSGEEEDSPLPIPKNADKIYWAAGSEFNLELWQTQWQDYESKCLEQLQKWAIAAKDMGINTEFRQIPGNAGRVICTLAQAWDADLIVIGSHGRLGLNELLLGSVSNYVLHHAPCSVLTIKLTVPTS